MPAAAYMFISSRLNSALFFSLLPALSPALVGEARLAVACCLLEVSGKLDDTFVLCALVVCVLVLVGDVREECAGDVMGGSDAGSVAGSEEGSPP